jgi:hypothetical protein
MAFGEHTSQFQVSKAFHNTAWQGLSTSVAPRRESQVALFEARVTGEVSDSDTDPTVYQLQLYSVTLEPRADSRLEGCPSDLAWSWVGCSRD